MHDFSIIGRFASIGVHSRLRIKGAFLLPGVSSGGYLCRHWDETDRIWEYGSDSGGAVRGADAGRMLRFAAGSIGAVGVDDCTEGASHGTSSISADHFSGGEVSS